MTKTSGWIEVQFKPWRDRLRIAWWVLTGQSFKVKFDTTNITWRLLP